MEGEKLSFSYGDGVLKISCKEPFFSQRIGPENMAVYFFLGRTLLTIQQFENQVSFILSALEFIKTPIVPPKNGNDVFGEIREKNAHLTLGQTIARLARHVSEKKIIEELMGIKKERNKLVHHFWRVLDWPFQNEDEIQREFQLAEHLAHRMAYGGIALAEYVQSSDSRIKMHYGAIDIETKRIVMNDGSEAVRLKE